MENVTSLEQRAIDYARRGDFGPDARRINDELTKLAPHNAGAWTRLARCCLELAEYDGAMAALDAALQLNPQNTIARNLQLEVAKRRAGPIVPAAKARAPRAKSATRAPASPRASAPRASRAHALSTGGFGRAEFAGLAHLEPAAAIDALARPMEALLMALNERPFAVRVVDARNRAGQSGSWLYRRNSVHPGGRGHVFAFQQGGRWEPQFNLGLYARTRWGRDALRAGIGFNLAASAADPDHEGQERLLEQFTRFQQLVATEWRQLLASWLRTNGGLIQHGSDGPAEHLLPDQAVSWLVGVQNPRDVRWVFFGRWLFADQPEHAVILADGTRLARWAEETFSDLLPLWSSVYRSP